ncbi:MAG: hypothetical protein HZB38_16040 [Planctomycetes bacterium]|nr:hypothetical protein [Planctomycetota bacterium]
MSDLDDSLLDDLSKPMPRVELSPWFADRERRNPFFWAAVHFVAPVFSSVIFHALLLTLLALKTWNIVATQQDKEDIEAGIALSGDLTGGFKWPGEGDLSLAQPDAPSPLTPPPLEFTPSPGLADQIKGARTDADSDDTGGFGIGSVGRSGVLGIGSGAGTGGGAGIGSGFGGGQGIGKANVWNLNASGNHFVYVVDFSGSITVVAEDLKRELKRSVGALRAPQTFDVIIFFSDTTADKERFITENFETQLVPADASNKRRFFSWIDRKPPRGQTEPLAAVKRALALKPDAVFFFSDGFFEEKVVQEIAKANPGQKTSIHTLAFDELIISDKSGLPKLTDGAKRLQRIAEQNRGKSKVVTGNDLVKR